MSYTRGSKDDFDRWARVTGDDGWSWDKMLPCILKVHDYLSSNIIFCRLRRLILMSLCLLLFTRVEHLTAPVHHRNTSDEIISLLHGHNDICSTPSSLIIISSQLDLHFEGPLGVSLPGLRLLTDSRVLNAPAALSSEFPFNHDLNSGNTVGIS